MRHSASMSQESASVSIRLYIFHIAGANKVMRFRIYADAFSYKTISWSLMRMPGDVVIISDNSSSDNPMDGVHIGVYWID